MVKVIDTSGDGASSFLISGGRIVRVLIFSRSHFLKAHNLRELLS
jgi:hypothetical protein